MTWRLERPDRDTIVATVFVGELGTTLQNAGSLRLHIGEYQIIGAALLLGVKRLSQLKFTVEGEEEALAKYDPTFAEGLT